MKLRSIGGLALGLVLLGAVVVVLWVRLAGGPALFGAMARARFVDIPVLISLTAACVLLRFLRWQYLLRRFAVRVPTRRSLAIYLSSLAGIATPAYVGETFRCAMLRREFGIPVRTTLSAWFAERLLDLAAVVLLGLVALTGSAALLVLAIAVAFGLTLLGSTSAAPQRGPAIVLPALGLTMLAWLPACLIIGLAARSLGLPLPLVDSVRVFAAATVGGGLSLMPAGMATTGSLAILQLQGLGLEGPDAIAVVSIFRLATAGITLAVGGAFLFFVLRSIKSRSRNDQHFDEIASEYLDQFPPHIWELLLERKTRLMSSALTDEMRIGLDLGCGLGRQALALERCGYRVYGIDPAHGLVRRGATQGLKAVTGSGLTLPFADASFDFVYTVGVLHHLTDPGAQDEAIGEVRRVLRPGGFFIVHETNPRNPLFRLYMGYLFPILKSIDEGIERWIDPERWRQTAGFDLERVEFFTFLPDFLPQPLLKVVVPFERRLERSRVRRYSVHYMAVLRRATSPALGLKQSTVAAASSV